jgi:Ser/Thr protein kinase RdoA (MazF antagonist)
MSATTTNAAERMLGAELETSAIAVPPAQAEQIARDHYGLVGRAEWLWGEKDSNYRLTLEDGTAYLLKILNPAEDPLVTSMHSEALLHVQAMDPGIPVQRIIRTRDGAADFRFVADDAAASHRITWDMKHAGGTRDLMPAFADPRERARLERSIDEFEAEIIPVMHSLPAQVIHNDFNMENILVDPARPQDITGIIDFGDMVHAPIVFDVGVAAAYQIGAEHDPVEAMCDLIGGYCGECVLSDAEIPLVYTAAVMRLVMRLAIPQWRARLFPEHAARFTIRSASVWEQLERLDAIPKESAIERLRAATRQG